MGAMRTLKMTIKILLVGLLLFAVLLTGCSDGIEPQPIATATNLPATPTSTPTLDPPTATPVPAAAVVNGERITLETFEREVARYLIAQESMGHADVETARAREVVLNDLIDQVLFAQAARDAGANFSDADVQSRLDALSEEIDLDAWMAEWGYIHEELLESLRLQMLAAYQRDVIIGSVPETVEQVELRQVFAFTEAGANRALVSLNSGTAFEDLAFEFSPDTGGYLGWVPRGYLLFPVVEEAAFNQPVGTYTEIIESEIGYHIVLVIDREERPLTSDARLTLERQAVHSWLEERRAESAIEVLVD
jgi:parvulin-like peptidyl-prolyl isomerase